MARTAARPSLADAIASTNTPTRATCSIARLLTSLAKTDADDLRTALGSDAITGAAISRGLEAIGHRVSQLTVNRHRRGLCACPR